MRSTVGLVFFFFLVLDFTIQQAYFPCAQCDFGFHYSTSTCGADKRTVAVVITVKVVKVMRQNLELFEFYKVPNIATHESKHQKGGLEEHVCKLDFSTIIKDNFNRAWYVLGKTHSEAADQRKILSSHKSYFRFQGSKHNMQIQKMCEIICRLSSSSFAQKWKISLI